MTKPNDNLSEIKHTLEEIRKAQFPEIAPSIIEAIVDIQFNNQENDSRVKGQTATHQAIKRYIEENS